MLHAIACFLLLHKQHVCPRTIGMRDTASLLVMALRITGEAAAHAMLLHFVHLCQSTKLLHVIERRATRLATRLAMRLATRLATRLAMRLATRLLCVFRVFRNTMLYSWQVRLGRIRETNSCFKNAPKNLRKRAFLTATKYNKYHVKKKCS